MSKLILSCAGLFVVYLCGMNIGLYEVMEKFVPEPLPVCSETCEVIGAYEAPTGFNYTICCNDQCSTTFTHNYTQFYDVVDHLTIPCWEDANGTIIANEPMITMGYGFIFTGFIAQFICNILHWIVMSFFLKILNLKNVGKLIWMIPLFYYEIFCFIPNFVIIFLTLYELPYVNTVDDRLCSFANYGCLVLSSILTAVYLAIYCNYFLPKEVPKIDTSNVPVQLV